MRYVLCSRRVSIVAGLIFWFGLSQLAWAHAILMESTPQQHSTVKGPDVSIVLRYNVRVDGSRSRFVLLGEDGSSRTLTLEKQTSPDVLKSQATGLQPGRYKLQWRVLASDGHISNGDVAFNVN